MNIRNFFFNRITANILAGVILILALIFGTRVMLDKITRHNLEITVPDLTNITVAEAIKYMEEKQFGSGSMEPKVMAAIKFARRFPGKKAIITSLAKAKDALENGAGTVITMALPQKSHKKQRRSPRPTSRAGIVFILL